MCPVCLPKLWAREWGETPTLAPSSSDNISWASILCGLPLHLSSRLCEWNMEEIRPLPNRVLGAAVPYWGGGGSGRSWTRKVDLMVRSLGTAL